VNQRPSIAGRIVGACADRAWIVVSLAGLLAAALASYALGHFALTTNTAELLSPKLTWRIREAAFDRLFPQTAGRIVIVLDARTPELGEQAAAALAGTLSAQTSLFRSVVRPDGGPFWAHNGLLYASTQDVSTAIGRLIKAEPFLGPMAADPSIRGLMDTLSTLLQGASSDQKPATDLRNPIRRLADALEGLLAGRPAFFSWRALIADGAPEPKELRRVILVAPKLEFARLEPGKVPIQAIRKAAQRLQLDAPHGVRVRLTGSVPLQDEELATLAERALLIAGLALGAIVLMLWMAVRSARLIAAILTTTVLGLLSAAAFGLAVFDRFNVISVAFIPLFVGLGIDFGIQFSVRYRAERATSAIAVRQALVASGRAMGRSLGLAATAIAMGFLAFTPTDYYGVSQLGVIAGLGMFIALILSLTLLPALIQLTSAPGAPENSANSWLTPIDSFILGHRRLVVGTGIGLALISAAVLPMLKFDFNPIHLRSPTAESVSTLVDLTSDPDRSINTLEAIRPSLAAADALAAKVGSLPEVHAARTLTSFIPSEQAQKIAIIADAANLLDLELNPIAVAPAPSDAEVIASLTRASKSLDQAAAADSAAAADYRRLAVDLAELARAGAGMRARAAQMLIPSLSTLLDQIRDSLQPQPVTLKSLPWEVTRDWLAPDGRARVSILPRGDSNDNAVLSRFVAAGARAIPDASGTALTIQAAGQAVVGAFTRAGLYSFISITALLLFALRRVRDVAICMAPIVLTGLLTMGSCVLIGQPLNFANIIALPLLFGIGVAFHIYFVMSWRAGGSHLLTSSLARAIFFSALATATGFGSLWASSHPGTASMGKLLMISLIWTLVSALLFQPALMGEPPAARTP
jgi:hopanoid biosynthesis associated RND transporter like protein HpnN